MSWAAVGGAAIGAAGSIIGGKASQPRTPKYRPYDFSSPLGTSSIDHKTKQITTQLSPEMQGYYNLFGGMANQYLGGNSATQPYQNFAFGLQSQFPGLFSGAQDSSYLDPSIIDRYNTTMGDYASQAGAAGSSVLGMGGFGVPQSQGLYDVGRGLLNNDYTSIFNTKLDAMRAAAAPYESLQRNDAYNRAFSQGRLGTTGGAGDIAEMYKRQGLVDNSRIESALGLADSLYSADRAAGLGAMGQGVSSLIQGQGLGYDTARGLFGLAGTMAGNGFNTNMSWSDALNARALQRLGNAQNIFGFGTGLQERDLTMGGNAINSQIGLLGPLMQQVQEGRANGQAPMGGGGGMTNPSGAAIGSFMTGIGTSIMNNGWPSFNRTPTINPNTGLNAYNAGNHAMPNINVDTSIDWSKFRG